MSELELFTELILNADRAGASQLVDRWAVGRGYNSILEELLSPAFKTIGELWEKDEDISLAQGYVAARIAEDVLAKIESNWPDYCPNEEKGPVVVGNILDDCHPVGLKIVSSFLKMHGWKVLNIGVDIEPKTFVDKALELGAKAIGVSAMMYSTAVNISGVRSEIDGRGLNGKIMLAVGGAVFRLRPDLADQVGADGMAKHAMDANALFDSLWARAL